MFKINSMLVRNELFKRGISIAAFAKLAGVNEVTLRKIIKEDAMVSSKVIGVLAKFFGVGGNELILKG